MKILVNFSDINELTFIDNKNIQRNRVIHANELVKYV